MRSVYVMPMLAVVLLAGATAAFGQGRVLVGKDAFGDWQADAPGVERQFAPSDLLAADQSASRANPANVVRRPGAAVPKVPDGFVATLIASGIEQPRVLRFAPNGDLFVANSGANQILVFPRDGEGVGAKQVFASEGLNRPYGIAFYPPGDDPEWVYVANTNSVVRYPYAPGDTKAGGAPETIVPKLPTGGHWTRDIAFSPDGKTLYVSVGSASNAAQNLGGDPPGGLEDWNKSRPLGAAWAAEADRADVLAFTPAGAEQGIFATGLRNCSGLGVQPANGELWCTVNERDGLGDNVPFDYATRVKQGAFYGWPWYYIGDNQDPRHDGERVDLKGKVMLPDVLIQAHSAPLNIAFSDTDAWGKAYKGNAFVTLHGSWNRGSRTGYKVVRLKFDGDEPTGVYEDFVTGFVTDDGSVWGRPVGVAVAGNGDLYVSEDGNGTIWKVSPK